MLNTGVLSFSPSTMLLFNKQARHDQPGAEGYAHQHGSAALKIASIKPDGKFGMTTTCGATVLAGANCVISVTFSPKTQGKLNGTVTIIDSASTKPQVIAMQGRGTE